MLQSPVRITFRDIAHSEALETHIREKVARLEARFEALMGCHVSVEMPHKHHHQGKLFNVRIDVQVPGGEVVATHDAHEDVYVGLREAFDHIKRQLQTHTDRVRGEVKHHEPGSRRSQADQHEVDE